MLGSGWTKSIFKPGNRISVSLVPAKGDKEARYPTVEGQMLKDATRGPSNSKSSKELGLLVCEYARSYNQNCDCSPGGKAPSAECGQFRPLRFERETALAV